MPRANGAHICESRTPGWGGEDRYSTEKWSWRVTVHLAVSAQRETGQGRSEDPSRGWATGQLSTGSRACPSLHPVTLSYRTGLFLAFLPPQSPFNRLPVSQLCQLTVLKPAIQPLSHVMAALGGTAPASCLSLASPCLVVSSPHCSQGCSEAHICSPAPLGKTQAPRLPGIKPTCLTWPDSQATHLCRLLLPSHCLAPPAHAGVSPLLPCS